MHIMDVVQNSISAGASLIEVLLSVNFYKDSVALMIHDNGKGMDEEFLKGVTSPFVTTRTTRKVGMGISLLKAGVEATGGSFEIQSKLGKGTSIQAIYVLSNIDRPPIGDFAGTMHTLIVCNPNIDFVVDFQYNHQHDRLDTREVRAVLGEQVPLDTPDVSLWLKESLREFFQPAYTNI